MARLRSDSTVNTLIIAAVAAIGIAYFVPRHLAGAPGAATATTAVSTLDRNAPAQPRAIWAASAPGRVEPKGGEIRISPQMPGRIAEVLVGVNDKVLPGTYSKTRYGCCA